MKPLERLKTEIPRSGAGGKYVIVGIDPGIVNTGIVVYHIYPHVRLISVAHTAIVGYDVCAHALDVVHCGTHASIGVKM